MNILILGAGAIGGYYGARLMQAGANVTFAVRPRRRDVIDRTGLVLHSALGEFHGSIRTVDSGRVGGPYDAVLLASKGYDLVQAIEDIAPAMGPDTVVLPFLNGLGVYGVLDRRFGRDRVLGGVAYIAAKLNAEGEIEHMGTGDTVLLGARTADRKAVQAAAALHALLLASQGVRVLTPEIEQALWDKWAMLAGGAALTCLMRGSIGQILATTTGTMLTERLMSECEAIAAAEGFPISKDGAARTRGLLFDASSGWTASMMRDIAQGASRIEHDEVVGGMCRLAREHKVDTPLLDAAYCNLQVYANARRSP